VQAGEEEEDGRQEDGQEGLAHVQGLRLFGLLALAASALTLNVGQALAAGPPAISAAWVTQVTATSARLNAQVNPNGFSTTARYEYLTFAEYEANLKAGKDPFAGALKSPAGTPTPLGSGTITLPFLRQLEALKAATSYRYRLVAVNSEGTTAGPTRYFATEAATPPFLLPDNRGWEMVSPVGKNGGAVEGPEASFGGGVFQAAAQGGAVTYTSSTSFGVPQGSSGASQYLASRTATGWSSQNITPALFSGSYPSEADSGAPFQIFSADLASSLLSNGKRCRAVGSDCPVANPPLPGSGAPAGYRNYYLRASGDGSAKAVLTTADTAALSLGPRDFEVGLAGASPDLSQVVLASCAAITANAAEPPGQGGCDPRLPASPTNLYRYANGALSLVNLLPGDTVGTPGARLAAQAGSIAADGSRVYFVQGGNLYLREGSQSFWVDESQGGGGTFETASADGSVAFFSKGGHLYRFTASSKAVTDLTPGGELKGVLGASADGSRVYYLDGEGLQLRNGAGVTEIAGGADAANYPPATGASRVSADGTKLLFLSSAPIGDYENEGETEAYLYSLDSGLACVSCNPTGERPLGSSSIPGAIKNGSALQAYKPRNLAAGGTRVYFDSFDALATQDTNNDRDVYQWQAQGSGGCVASGGCVNLISSGRSQDGASFIDASADGSDVFFTTNESLVPSDPGSIDLYDARVGGGFPLPPVLIPCNGDACQPLPGEPEDPTPGTLLAKPQGNPPLSFPGEGAKKGKGKKGKGKKSKRAGKGKRVKGGSR
jgi:hypothetical protein